MDGILLIDKPAGITSHDVVDHLRRRFGIRRVGHAGTLDPAATGLLILLLGKATTLSETFLAGKKRYQTTLLLGTATDTLDLDGKVTSQQPIPPLSRPQIEAVLGRFVGEIEQEVPAYSAIRIGGKRSYDLARAGVAVPVRRRRVEIESLKLTAFRPSELDLEVVCSKGTYIRSLGADLAKALGTVGCLKTLRRTGIGNFSIEQAVKLEEAGEKDLLPMGSG